MRYVMDCNAFNGQEQHNPLAGEHGRKTFLCFPSNAQGF